jgi:hypothetical protein
MYRVAHHFWLTFLGHSFIKLHCLYDGVLRFSIFRLRCLLYFYVNLHFIFDDAEQTCVLVRFQNCIPEVSPTYLTCGTVSAGWRFSGSFLFLQTFTRTYLYYALYTFF